MNSSLHAYSDEYINKFKNACYKISEAVSSTASLPLILKEIHAILKTILPAENLFLSISQNAQQIRFPYYVDQIQSEDPLKIYKKEGLTGHVMDTGKTFWLKRDQEIPRTIGLVGPNSVDWIGCPLKDKYGKTFGVFAVQSYDLQKTYTEQDKDFLEFVARIIMQLIQLRNTERELAIRDIAALVEKTINIHELYPQLHAILKEIIPAVQKSLVIVLAKEKAGEEIFFPVYWRDERDDYTDYHWPRKNGLCGYIYNFSKTSLLFQEGVSSLPSEVLANVGVPAAYWLGVPLIIDKKIVGIVYVQTYDPTEIITKEDEATLNAVAPYIAEAINRTQFQSHIRSEFI